MQLPQVGTLASGEIDYEELRARLAANVARPAIINVNIGTTVRGAVDDLDRVLAILQVRRWLESRAQGYDASDLHILGLNVQMEGLGLGTRGLQRCSRPWIVQRRCGCDLRLDLKGVGGAGD